MNGATLVDSAILAALSGHIGGALAEQHLAQTVELAEENDRLRISVKELWTIVHAFHRYTIHDNPNYIDSPLHRATERAIEKYCCGTCDGDGWILVGYYPPFEQESCGDCGPPLRLEEIAQET